MDSFSCSPLNTLFINRLPENPEYAEMRHGDVIDVTDQRAASVRLFVFLSFPRAGMGV